VQLDGYYEYDTYCTAVFIISSKLLRERNKSMSRLTLTGIIFIILGIISLIIQNTFYGYLDADGVLHDSLFLPLTFIFALIGLIIVMIDLFLKVR